MESFVISFARSRLKIDYPILSLLRKKEEEKIKKISKEARGRIKWFLPEKKKSRSNTNFRILYFANERSPYPWSPYRS